MDSYVRNLQNNGINLWDAQEAAEQIIQNYDARISQEIFSPAQLTAQREIKRIETNVNKIMKLEAKGHISIRQQTIFYDNSSLESVLFTAQSPTHS